jgi:hypothetical protein
VAPASAVQLRNPLVQTFLEARHPLAALDMSFVKTQISKNGERLALQDVPQRSHSAFAMDHLPARGLQ